MKRLIAVGALGLMLLLQPHLASAAVGGLDLRLGLEVAFDDNVFEYSDRDLDAFNPALEKFKGLSSTDDWILVPSATVEYRTAQKHRTLLGFEAKPKFYRDNDAKNYQVFTARVTQELPQEWEVGLQYQMVPSFFYKRLADPPNQTHTYADAEFGINTLRGHVRKDIGGWFSGTLLGSYGSKNYNSEFNERDIDIIATKAEASFRPWKPFRFTVEAGFDRGRSAGWDDPQYDSDTSYDQWSIGVSASQKLLPWLSCGAGYAHESKKFITDLVHDRGHYQRVDTTGIFDAYLRLQLHKGLSLRTGFELTDCKSEKDGVELEYNTFSRRRWTVSTSYEF